MASLTLAIDSSSTVLSVAVVKNADSVFELNSLQFQDHSQLNNARSNAGDDDSLPPGYVRKHSKGKGKTSRIFPPGASTLLAPMLKAALDQYGTTLKNIDLIKLMSGSSEGVAEDTRPKHKKARGGSTGCLREAS